MECERAMKKKRAGRKDKKCNDPFHSNVQRECVISFFVILYLFEILNNFNNFFFKERKIMVLPLYCLLE